MTWFILSRVGLGLDELRALGPTAWAIDPWIMSAASLTLLFGYVGSATIWGILVRDLGGPSLPVARTVPLFMVANLGRYIPGKVWQIAGLAALARREGVPVATATAAAVAGQGTALAAASALGMIALFGAPEPYPTWGLAGLALVAAGLALAAIPRVYAGVIAVWFRLARTAPPRLPGPARGFRWFALYLGNWAVYAGAFWLMVRSLGFEGPPVPIGSAFAAAYVLGYAMVFAPAGLGPREGFLIAFLTPELGAGPAGIAALCARLWTTGVEVVPAAGLWLWSRRSRHDV